MENRKKGKKQGKAFKIIAISIVLIALIILLVIKNINNKEVLESDSKIIGIFIYEDGTKYEFNKNGKGAMYIGKEKYEYTYKEEGNKLIIDFKDEKVHDAKYSYEINNDILKLIGEDGTAGGNYTLKKQ